MRSGMAVWLKEEALVNDALKDMGQAKKGPRRVRSPGA